MIRRTLSPLLAAAALCLFACGLSADPITLTATSASAAFGQIASPPIACSSSGFCFGEISATGPSFSLSGGSYTDALFENQIPVFFTPGQTSFNVSGTQFGPGHW